MNIGYFHSDRWPPLSGDSVYSWQIFSRLQKRHRVYTDNRCPFPGAVKIYRDIRDCLKLVNAVDVVLINTEGFFNFYVEKFSLFSLLRKKKLPVVWLTQAPLEESLLFPGSSWRFFYQKFFRICFARFVDENICVSEIMKRYSSTALGIPDSRVVPNGSDPKLFTPHQKYHPTLRASKRCFNVFWAGSGDMPWQGIDTMIRVATKMQHIDPTIRFVFVISNLRNELPVLENTCYLQGVSHFRLPEVLAHADAFLCIYHQLLPMGFYNSSVKLFDFMSMARPVIASNIGQIREVITHGKNGLLTDGREDDIIRNILYVKNNPAKARAIGVNARKSIVDTYNWDRAVDDIEAILAGSLQNI